MNVLLAVGQSPWPARTGFALLLSVGRLTAAEPLPPLNPVHAETVDLLAGGGFEDPEGKAWRFSDWPPRPDTGAKLIAKSIYYSQDVVHTGDWAVCFDLTTVGEDRILLIQQAFGREKLAAYDGRRVRMSAWTWVATGPPGYDGRLTVRQWGPPGAPPIDHATLRVAGARGEWRQSTREFVLRLGETTRGDITVGMRQVPDLNTAPVCYVDDVKLEVVAEPSLTAQLLGGRTVFASDSRLPLRVAVSEAAWHSGRRSLCVNVTSADGETGYSELRKTLPEPLTVIEIDVPAVSPGAYAVRLALGSTPGERAAELLVPFRRVEGPFARN